MQNDGAMPLNREVFDKYIIFTSDFAFLPERIEDVRLAGEDGKMLNLFSADIYKNVLFPEADKEQLRECLEKYADAELVASLLDAGDEEEDAEPADGEKEAAETAESGEVNPPQTKTDVAKPSGGGSRTPAPPVTSAVETNISLSTSRIVLEIGLREQLTATVTPDGGTVTWSSQNSAVASVGSTGIVEGKGVGTTTITASSGGKSASCTVAVQ
jgi:hypothetical protein